MENGEDNGEENSQLVRLTLKNNFNYLPWLASQNYNFPFSFVESSSPSTHSSDSGSRTIFNLKKRISELESEVTVFRRKLKIVPILFAHEGKDCTEFVINFRLVLVYIRKKENNTRLIVSTPIFRNYEGVS